MTDMCKLLSIALAFLMSITMANAQNVDNILKAKPFTASGSLTANTTWYGTNGIERNAPLSYGLYGRLNLSIYGINFPLYVSLRDHSFNYSRTFYRLKLNPSYKWIKLHIGDTRMNFNRYTLSGRTIRGAGIELTPSIFRIKAVYGKAKDQRAYRDTLQLGIIPIDTYTRRTAGLAFGLGKENNHLDLYAVRTWDEESSGETGTTPQDNLVVGSSLRLRLFRKLRLQANVALSALTHNTQSFGNNSLTSESIDQEIFNANLSTDVSYAGDFSASYRFRSVGLKAKISYIQAFYDPLSIAYINNDVLNYTLGTKFNLGRGTVLVNADVGIQENNLSGRKASTSHRVILNLLTQIKLSRALSASIRYANFQQEFQARLIQLDELYTYAVNTSNVLVNINYQLGDNDLPVTLRLSGGLQDFNTVASDEISGDSYRSYHTSITVRMPLQEGFTISSGLSYRNYYNGVLSRQNYGFSASARKRLVKKKLNAAWTTSFAYNDTGALRIGWTLRNALNFNYQLQEKQQLQLQLLRLDRKFATGSIHENRASINYSLRF